MSQRPSWDAQRLEAHADSLRQLASANDRIRELESIETALRMSVESIEADLQYWKALAQGDYVAAAKLRSDLETSAQRDSKHD